MQLNEHQSEIGQDHIAMMGDASKLDELPAVHHTSEQVAFSASGSDEERSKNTGDGNSEP